MDSTFVQNVPSELICYICKDYFTDPFTLTCGHNFCTPCLCLLWEDAQHPPRCPVCRAVSPWIDFKSIIFAAKKVHASKESVACQLPNSAKQVCRVHLVVKDLFCPTDKSPLCLHCANSQRHAIHRHSPISQAAEQCREKLLVQMKSLWKSRQKNQKNLNKEYNLFRVWQGFVNLRMMMIRAEYPKVYQYLQEEKQKHLESLAVEGKIIFNQLRRNVGRMRHMGKLLRKMYEELKEMCCETDVDLFQDLGDIMKRSQIMQLHIPQPVNPQLSSWTITGMSERLNNFRVYLTLDHNISNYRVALFEDLRHLQCSPDYQDMPHSPASPQYMPLWGAQTFTSGKHYWEVDVGNSCNWIIGLCKESWINRNGMLLNSEGIFLLLCIQVDDICRLFSASPPLRHYIQRPQGWIGVFLDYECGTVSFVNVAQSSLICNLRSCSFSCPLRPFICYGPK
ncbi:PREDICTED: tripartite motif-containing protein 77 [Odobenus rosmarus divergens]|uniref:Tripartite motif-containing protein 77 n=1 Tax=Odobenus rosmarus divergens TaxID=9708 RepID=A0A2U3WRQ7_ODORO|nr:PREDICTED: tripartite motif-containing protein 77 [Odobenus rosmarus divergens]